MASKLPNNDELVRIELDARRKVNWKRWGPYLSERQWGTVREDYSPDGACWNSVSHDQARSRAYRWGEDGILGITDRQCRLCFALSMWNGRDPILKERLFGLTNGEGNHGEDCKELYYYLDSTPTHSYMKGLYKYPQSEYPYARLVEENRRRGKSDPEFEIQDTGVFDENRYFDVFAEYAKNSPNDILIRITVANRGPQTATIHLLPTLWFRNTWSWGCTHEGCWTKPYIRRMSATRIEGEHQTLGRIRFDIEPAPASPAPELIFTDNETNCERIFDWKQGNPYVKDAFHRYVTRGEGDAIHPKSIGTKAAAYYLLEVPAGQEVVVRIRLSVAEELCSKPFGPKFDATFASRVDEADLFYSNRIPDHLTSEEKLVMRHAFAGLLWTKQFYHYIIEDWLKGDPNMPPPPGSRWDGRNHDWLHLYSRDVISMPDKWEYPWFAAWDLAFHMIPMATIDPHFAKQQLLLFLREWYMHPNGQLPAYEFAFDDVNPPVHAWACWRVYKMTGVRGKRDRDFLARCFQKLLLNFTWWVNRKDIKGKHIFAGGFLGLDNIGLFDRSQPLPTGHHLEQADGTAWMAFYCATMLSMAIELASEDPEYEDIASKFFEHFVAIADAMNTLGGTGLWDEQDGFYYDQLHTENQAIPLRIRSMVGLIPTFAVEVLEDEVLDRLPGFKKRMDWFLTHREDLARQITFSEHKAHLPPMQAEFTPPGDDVTPTSAEESTPGAYLLAIPSRHRLERVLRYLLDEKEFLSPYGVRSLSAIHKEHPFRLALDGVEHSVQYTPGESDTGVFGGNSNWRGPIWFPLNYLLIESLQRYHHYYGDTLKVECPTGSGKWMDLNQVASELARRLCRIFLPDEHGHRPCHGGNECCARDPHFKDLPLFYEYFHGDNGRGVGASHQTGWTALITRLLVTAACDRVPGPARQPQPLLPPPARKRPRAARIESVI